MAGSPHVIGLDAGTTGITALAVAQDGSTLARASREFPQYFPQPGWVEHDALEIWATCQQVLADLYAASGVQPDSAVALGLTNQRETVVAWDRRTGEPRTRAIVWQDRRTTSICEEWRAHGLEEEARRRTGLVLDPYFSASKLRWWALHEPRVRDAAIGTIDSWLLWKLTGHAVHATDPTNASRTLLYNIHTRAWDDTLFAAFEVPRAGLPEVLPSSGAFGTLRGVPPLADGLPISGIAGDQQAALFGQCCVAEGDWKSTYGTGCFLMLHTGTHALLSRRGLLTTLACGPRGEPAYALEGAVFTAGAAVQWLRDGLGIVTDAAECDRLAQTVEDAGGVHLVPAFTGLGAPWWRPDARGAIVGLTRGTRREHLCRAAIEAMAYQTCDVFDAMQSDLRDTDPQAQFGPLRVDGGASRSNLLMQAQSDLLGLAVDRPVQIETTALGAAFLAGLGCGFWRDAQALATARRTERRFEPQLPAADRAVRLGAWRAAVQRVL